MYSSEYTEVFSTKSRETSGGTLMDSALACRESSTYVCIPCISCASWHIHSRDSQVAYSPAPNLSQNLAAALQQFSSTQLCQAVKRAVTSPTHF